MKKIKTGTRLFALCLLLGAVNSAFAEDSIKLNSNDGSTKFVVQDNAAATVFSADSDGNAYMVGYSSANRYYGDGSALTNVSTHTFKIGDNYGGGKIFWMDAAGKQILIVAATDQSGLIKWSNDSVATGATLDGIYAGKANTVMISTTQHAGSYAAQICSDYSVAINGEFYDDWYLPSKYEFQLLYSAMWSDGSWNAAWYWTSTEYSPTDAWLSFVNSGGSMSNMGKLNGARVRCIRAGHSTSIGALPTNAETVIDGAYLSSMQTFTGANTFNVVTAASATITGEARLARAPVTAADAGITLTAADFGKTITVNSAGAQTVALPAVTVANLGATVTVVKLGAGAVTIQAAASTYIEDSTSGGAIYNDVPVPAYAAITLRLVTATQWQPIEAQGAWATR